MSKLRNKLLATGFLVLFASCTNRPQEVLSMKEMTQVLVDIHTLDGVFSSSEYNRINAEEKRKYYMAVFANHHITQAQFDSSLLWYSKDPKRFEKVYTLVIDQLTAEEEAVKSGKYSDLLRKRRTLAHDGLWTGSPRMKINTDSLSHYRQLAFSVKDTKLMMGDRYELRFLARVEACDTCGNLHTRLNLAYAGGRVDSLSLPLPADGKWRRYTLQLDARDKEKVDSLYGHLVAASSFPCGLSVEIDSIRLVREYYKETQEDLRAATCHLESLRTFPYRLFPTPGELTNPLPCSSRFDCVTE